MLAADREALSAHAPRYRGVPWKGVAALPDRGEPQVDDLVAAVNQLFNADAADVAGTACYKNLHSLINKWCRSAFEYSVPSACSTSRTARKEKCQPGYDIS